MIKKVLTLSKVLIKENIEEIIYLQQRNKKTILKYFMIILEILIGLLCFKIINWLDMAGEELLFLKIYLPIVMTIFTFQIVLICGNIYFFSKDLENLITLPLKPVEILLAKFINITFIIYGMEALLLVMPMFIYGIISATSLIYFASMLFFLIIMPIFLVIIVSIVMLFVIQIIKIIKNKDLFFILLTILVSIILSILEILVIREIFSNDIITISENANIENMKININLLHEKLNRINNFFVIINPSITLLTSTNLFELFIETIKIIILTITIFYIFSFLGKYMYLKNILINVTNQYKKDKIKKQLKIKYNKKTIKKSYIENEIKKIVKNPTFFLQGIFQYIFVGIALIFLINLFMPIFIDKIIEEDMVNKIGQDNFILQIIYLILGFIQIIYTFANLSSTAISRDRNNANLVKYIPVPLYKQFIYKNTPQIVLNIIPIIAITIISNFYLPKEKEIYIYIILTIIMAMMINIINCFIVSIIDFRKPNLNWSTETTIFKNNNNKIYQYFITIITILLLIYFTNIFANIKIYISLSITFIFFLIVLITVNFLTKKYINKIFENIN